MEKVTYRDSQIAFQNITQTSHRSSDRVIWLKNYLFQLQNRKGKPALDNSDSKIHQK